MALGVCPGHAPSQAQPFGCTNIQHSRTFLENGQRQGPGEICRDLCEVPRDDDTGMQPAGREGGSTERYFQEKLGEEEPTIPDASKVEDVLRRHCF